MFISGRKSCILEHRRVGAVELGVWDLSESIATTTTNTNTTSTNFIDTTTTTVTTTIPPIVVTTTMPTETEAATATSKSTGSNVPTSTFLSSSSSLSSNAAAAATATPSSSASSATSFAKGLNVAELEALLKDFQVCMKESMMNQCLNAKVMAFMDDGLNVEKIEEAVVVSYENVSLYIYFSLALFEGIIIVGFVDVCCFGF
jgi:hypothetical protein